MSEIQALLLALVFGIVYNWLITRWDKAPYKNSFIAIFVVIGVAATLIISALVTRLPIARLQITWRDEVIVLSSAQNAAWYEFKFFCMAGLPMFFGALWRHASQHDDWLPKP